MPSIRRLPKRLSLCAALACAALGAQAASHDFVYVGTYTSGTSSQGIYVFDFNLANGSAAAPTLAGATADPSFLEVHPNGRSLYAVDETDSFNGMHDTGGVSAFAITASTGHLSLLDSQPTRGGGPAYVGLDHSGTHALVANYDGGNVAVFPIAADGSLGASTGFAQDSGHGPTADQDGPHAHIMVAAPDDRYALVADLGADKVYSYKLDDAAGTLDPANSPVRKTASGAGPRHLTFGASGKFVYVLNEINSTVATYSYAAKKGTLKALQTVSTLPAGFSGSNTGAEIALHPNGKFLYASNRGQNAIAVFAIDAATGLLTLKETVSTQGKTPRGFAIDPTGAWLIAANQNSNNLVTFAVDAGTGHLTATGTPITVAAPVCVKFLPRAGTE